MPLVVHPRVPKHLKTASVFEESYPKDGPSMDTALLLALDELRARGTRVCHSTTSLAKATFLSGLKTTKHFCCTSWLLGLCLVDLVIPQCDPVDSYGLVTRYTLDILR